MFNMRIGSALCANGVTDGLDSDQHRCCADNSEGMQQHDRLVGSKHSSCPRSESLAV